MWASLCFDILLFSCADNMFVLPPCFIHFLFVCLSIIHSCYSFMWFLCDLIWSLAFFILSSRYRFYGVCSRILFLPFSSFFFFFPFLHCFRVLTSILSIHPPVLVLCICRFNLYCCYIWIYELISLFFLYPFIYLFDYLFIFSSFVCQVPCRLPVFVWR